MASVLRSWFGPKASTDKGAHKSKGDDVYQQVTDDQPYNPYTEVKLLTGHTATVHQIAKIDEQRFISASDDSTAVVWDSETGRRLHVLRGHKDSITCVLPLQSHNDSGECCLIMTASSDDTIRLWDLNANERFEVGLCQRVIDEHKGVIKCLAQLSHDMVCSGGQDLCLWDKSGRLLSKCDRSRLEESSPIHSILKLDSRHFGVVAASNYRSLAVYDINKSTMMETDRYELHFVRYLYNSHREDICCLTSISSNFFASGSHDGVILLWSTNTLSAMKMFHCVDASLPKELPPPTSSSRANEIRYILVMSERYLFAAIGNGFRVYDVIAYEDSQGHPKPLASHLHAHQQPITYMEFLEDRSMLATASEDNTVRLWGHPNRVKRDIEPVAVTDSQTPQGKLSIEDFLGLELNPQRGRRRTSLPLPVMPTLLGELLLHSDHVKVVQHLGVHGLVTCGNDSLIILWKDGEKERERKDLEIRSFLKGENF